jgi:hypothetical protein
MLSATASVKSRSLPASGNATPATSVEYAT